MYLGWTLMWFEVVSGLKIKPSKSKIILVGRVDNVEGLVAEFVLSLLRTWAIPLGAPHKSMGVMGFRRGKVS